MKISICIPTWEQYGKGSQYLKHLLTTISYQNYDNFNVVVSDQSSDNNIENIIYGFNKKFEIFYIKNHNDIGNGPANTNNSIINADGDIIKIMFQDDFFYQKNALKTIAKEFEDKDCEWVVNGCNHTHNDGDTFSNFIIPTWNDNILFGINTISSPSVLSFRKNSNCFFDKNLTMLMDCEMYYQLYIKYGLPKIINDCLITNRMHQYQISSLYNKDINLEINYIKSKYKI